MRILVFEYFNSGAPRDLPAPGLLQEGALIRDAVLADLQLLDDIQISLVHDPRLAVPESSADIKTFADDADFAAQLSDWLDAADMFLPIAPETDGILKHLCRTCESRNKPLLNSSAVAVDIAGSKSKTIQTLRAVNVACVPTVIHTQTIPFEGDVVIKPDDGVGCENATILQAKDVGVQTPKMGYIAQPYLSGQAASMNLLCFNGEACLLSANVQEMARYGQALRLRACGVNMLDCDRRALECLAQNIAAAIPGLSAYVGVDFLVCDNKFLVLEINPRLTSSYIGLHRSIGVNPAGLMIESLKKQSLPRNLTLERHPVRVPIL